MLTKFPEVELLGTASKLKRKKENLDDWLRWLGIYPVGSAIQRLDNRGHWKVSNKLFPTDMNLIISCIKDNL